MDKHLLIFSSCLLSGFLIACTNIKNQDQDHTGAICRELKSEIVFSGSTSNIREAEIENSTQPLMEKNYNDDKCEN
jgi:hypothetical protein